MFGARRTKLLRQSKIEIKMEKVALTLPREKSSNGF
jgi:hypothetical protein